MYMCGLCVAEILFGCHPVHGMHSVDCGGVSISNILSVEYDHF